VSQLTLPAEANNTHRTDDIVCPSVTALLDGEQVVFLLIVEDVLGAGIARHVLHKGRFDIPVLESVMLLTVRFVYS
jgi:ribonuclease D